MMLRLGKPLTYTADIDGHPIHIGDFPTAGVILAMLRPAGKLLASFALRRRLPDD
jgi:hypothetical protein